MIGSIGVEYTSGEQDEFYDILRDKEFHSLEEMKEEVAEYMGIDVTNVSIGK